MIEKQEKVILVHVDFGKGLNIAEDLAEFRQLTLSAGAMILEEIVCRRNIPEPKFFIGSGKAEEIHLQVLFHKPDLVIFNHPLTPAQERNLTQTLGCRVIDRTALILDIFAQRARSFEGKLQVEQARLQHLATRLVRGWTHLERQKGGIGLRGGPGEKQLETDRRLLRLRVDTIKKRLAKVRTGRYQNRRARKRSSIPTVALVGYTNAGKSTLFNKLTDADVYVADKLFATLDPTLRKVRLPQVGEIIFADTVGFIRHLPHELVEAFRATLEEVREADLLLHVVDASDTMHQEKIEAVNKVIVEIDAGNVPQLLVYNKIDRLPEVEARIDYDQNQIPVRVWVSAISESGFDQLFLALQKKLQFDYECFELCLPPTAGKIKAQLYETGGVISEQTDEDGNIHLTLRMLKTDYLRLIKQISSDRR